MAGRRRKGGVDDGRSSGVRRTLSFATTRATTSSALTERGGGETLRQQSLLFCAVLCVSEELPW